MEEEKKNTIKLNNKCNRRKKKIKIKNYGRFSILRRFYMFNSINILIHNK